MKIISTVIIVIFCIFGLLAVLAPCIISSRISQEEESKELERQLEELHNIDGDDLDG